MAEKVYVNTSFKQRLKLQSKNKYYGTIKFTNIYETFVTASEMAGIERKYLDGIY